ncbi:sodium/calcium exchanger NCL-like isoform X2 [Lycium barbarum]|uniref:sodium/calcium exchanger NCL-like isoform X2 n=1 Tax=Lycium barbarum TaxID=112863 RepID=UPI00293F4A9A|nr:sodium/calcium exchanger NCL-like isoform X2 [Lycium barbarum]
MPSILNCTSLLLLNFFTVTIKNFFQLSGSEINTQWISDGVVEHKFKNRSKYLSLGSSEELSTGDKCIHMYGFFPCAENIGGYLFMIVTFQYLLILGEKVLAIGSNRLFSILDTGIFGASIFPTLITWPRIVMAFVSGLLVSREQAQVSVSSALGSNVGSSVLNLTVLWGICVILGRQNISGNSNTQSSAEPPSSTLKLEDLKSKGIITNNLTGYIAGIMFLSLAPFTIMLFGDIISSSVGKRITILIALIVSVTFLLSYFSYQMWNPLIQQKSLEYIKHEQLVQVFVQHIQRQARGNLFKGGCPDINALKRLFAKTDKDRSHSITVTELEELVKQLESEKVKVDGNFALSTLSRIFDKNKDERINEEEFIEGCKKLLQEAKDDSTSKKLLDEVIKAYTEGQRKEMDKIQELVPRVLKQIQNQAIESENLLKDDGSPNIESIKRLFRKLDGDHNSYLIPSELEKLTENVKFREARLNRKTSVKEIMKDFDQNDDHMIDENEFLRGMTYWLHNAKQTTKEHHDKVMWGEVDKFLDEAERENNKGFDYSLVLKWEFCKSVLQVILGIAILTLCADPIMDNIIRLARAIDVPSFFLSFVIVPLAINARTAITAITLLSSANQQTSTTSSLTFSEIYVGVILNNIMGMSTVLTVLYAKDLRWEYSAEVLVSMVICAVTGFFAFIRTTYPLWTCIVAFLFYPIALVLLYIFQ